MACGACARIGTNALDGPKYHAPGCLHGQAERLKQRLLSALRAEEHALESRARLHGYPVTEHRERGQHEFKQSAEIARIRLFIEAECERFFAIEND